MIVVNLPVVVVVVVVFLLRESLQRGYYLHEEIVGTRYVQTYVPGLSTKYVSGTSCAKQCSLKSNR
jgi:hypothetical protein